MRLLKSSLNIRRKIVAFFDRNSSVILVIAMALIVVRFFWLNYDNWQSGSISNGEPGVKYWLDSGRYIDGADKLIDRERFVGRENQYVGYLAVIALLKVVGADIVWVVIIQIIIALLAAVTLYFSALKFTKSRLAGLLASGLFLCNPFIVQWHQYVLTESLYTSFIILFLWSLIRLANKINIKNIFISVLLLIVTMSIRPNGWILLPVFIIFLIFVLNLKRKIKFFAAAGVFTLFIVSILSIGTMRNAVNITAPVKNLQDGVTVWQHHELYLDMPQNPELYNDNISSGAKYIFRHPFSVIKLGVVRAGYSLIHIRPYHSPKYKLRVLWLLVPVYLLSLVAIFSEQKNKITFASLLIIIGHLLIVALTYAEHDSRFDIYILPVFYLLAAAGFSTIIGCFRQKIVKLTSQS